MLFMRIFPILVGKIKVFSALYNPGYREIILLVKTVAFFPVVFCPYPFTNICSVWKMQAQVFAQ